MVELIKIFVIATSLVVLNAHAFDSIYDDQALMLNINLPLGVSEKQLASPRLELRFDSVQSENNSVADESKYDLARKPALMELPLGQEGVHSIKVGGRNIMLGEGIYAADGDTQSSNTGLILGGIIVLVGVIIGVSIALDKNTEAD